MANFDDGIVGLGQAIPAAIRGYYDMKHFEARNREDEAKVKAQEENKIRQIWMDRMTMQRAGYKVPNSSEDLYSSPLEIDPASYEGILNIRRKAQAAKMINDLKSKGVDLSEYGIEPDEAISFGTKTDQQAKGKGLVSPGLIPREPKGLLQAKPMKLNTEDRKRVDNIVMGRQAINDMAKSLAGGENTFSMVGDNPFTFARTRWEEAIGRMQSGGAITDEEGKRFRKLIPSVTDSADIQWQKLQKMQQEMDQRLGRFGIKPGEVDNYSDTDAERFIGEKTGGKLAGPPQDPQISDYARQNGLDYPTAERILRNRGYGQ